MVNYLYTTREKGNLGNRINCIGELTEKEYLSVTLSETYNNN